VDGVEASLRLLRVGNFNRTIAKQTVAKQMATPAIHFLQGECILVRHSAATSIEQDLDIDTEAGSTLPQTSSPQHFLFCSFRHPASRGSPRAIDPMKLRSTLSSLSQIVDELYSYRQLDASVRQALAPFPPLSNHNPTPKLFWNPIDLGV